MASDYYDSEVTFEILEHIGVISTFATGWKREINLVSWNGSAGKYDIREWDPFHERMSRGITLKENEMRILLELMRRRRNGVRSGIETRPQPASRMDDDMTMHEAVAEAIVEEGAESSLTTEQMAAEQRTADGMTAEQIEKEANEANCEDDDRVEYEDDSAESIPGMEFSGEEVDGFED